MIEIKYSITDEGYFVEFWDGQFCDIVEVPDPNTAMEISALANTVLAKGDPGLAHAVAALFHDLAEAIDP